MALRAMCSDCAVTTAGSMRVVPSPDLPGAAPPAVSPAGSRELPSELSRAATPAELSPELPPLQAAARRRQAAPAATAAVVRRNGRLAIMTAPWADAVWRGLDISSMWRGSPTFPPHGVESVTALAQLGHVQRSGRRRRRRHLGSRRRLGAVAAGPGRAHHRPRRLRPPRREAAPRDGGRQSHRCRRRVDARPPTRGRRPGGGDRCGSAAHPPRDDRRRRLVARCPAPAAQGHAHGHPRSTREPRSRPADARGGRPGLRRDPVARWHAGR